MFLPSSPGTAVSGTPTTAPSTTWPRLISSPVSLPNYLSRRRNVTRACAASRLVHPFLKCGGGLGRLGGWNWFTQT
ncbi:hypothetical protein IEO21_06333 [Rhodonia placenta]|uniref:Uncharacterized protein n=1 Tax=Rhodonia placenta TaxID=104341 RepID=A0A8H7P071_9APHY|nr:hypothetical protein IEO21_06333 [Postia placenta]